MRRRRRSIGRVATIEKSLGKFVEKGKLSAADRDAALGRLDDDDRPRDAGGRDYVVEAIFEDARRQVRAVRAARRASPRPDVILASNTSSISITTLGGRDEPSGARARDALHESRSRS